MKQLQAAVLKPDPGYLDIEYMCLFNHTGGLNEPAMSSTELTSVPKQEQVSSCCISTHSFAHEDLIKVSTLQMLVKV